MVLPNSGPQISKNTILPKPLMSVSVKFISLSAEIKYSDRKHVLFWQSMFLSKLLSNSALPEIRKRQRMNVPVSRPWGAIFHCEFSHSGAVAAAAVVRLRAETSVAILLHFQQQRRCGGGAATNLPLLPSCPPHRPSGRRRRSRRCHIRTWKPLLPSVDPSLRACG